MPVRDLSPTSHSDPGGSTGIGVREMKNFKHVNARSIDEAVSYLKRYGEKAHVIAGGTDLLGKMKDEILPRYPEALVNIKTIPGLEFIKASKDLIGDTPLVMVTGSGSEDVAVRAFKAGVTDYIVKGHDLSERLSSLITDLLENPSECSTNIPKANLSCWESAMILINSIQDEMMKDGFVAGLQQNIIIEFTQISDFNSFTRWIKNRKNVILDKVEILENKYVLLVSISPRTINRIS